MKGTGECGVEGTTYGGEEGDIEYCSEGAVDGGLEVDSEVGLEGGADSGVEYATLRWCGRLCRGKCGTCCRESYRM